MIDNKLLKKVESALEDLDDPHMFETEWTDRHLETVKSVFSRVVKASKTKTVLRCG